MSAPEGGLHDRPVCDFCSDADPAWTFPAVSYDDEKLLARSVGDWLACETCARLINRNEWTRLAERAAARTGAGAMMVELAGEEYAVAEIMRMHRNFRSHRTGAAKRMEKGEAI